MHGYYNRKVICVCNKSFGQSSGTEEHLMPVLPMHVQTYTTLDLPINQHIARRGGKKKPLTSQWMLEMVSVVMHKFLQAHKMITFMPFGSRTNLEI
jgi:hypothetical protein